MTAVKVHKISKSEHCRRIIKQYPTMNNKEVANRANCDVSLVYQARCALNKETTVTLPPQEVSTNVVIDINKLIKEQLSPEKYKGYLIGSLIASAMRKDINSVIRIAQVLGEV